MIKLQKPPFLYFQGKIRPWEEAVLHVSTEAVTRGLNVFEGMKGYWQPDGSFGLVALEQHWMRLRRSARLLHIPFEMPYAEFEAACHDLVRRLYKPGVNMWVRATLYVIEGHWGEGTVADLVLTAYHTPPSPFEPVALGISTWQRAPDAALPCRIKTSTNYQVARLAKIEGRDRGFDEMILLNPAGRVAEALGCCLLVARDGRIATPPAYEGALESITVSIAEQLCVSMGIPFERRPIERSEILVADEVALAGTLVEITEVTAIDGTALPGHDLIRQVQARYLEAVAGIDPHDSAPLSIRPHARYGQPAMEAAE